MIIKIKPNPNSSKFIKKVAGTVDLYTENDRGDNKFEGSFSGSRFPGTVQIERTIKYSVSARRWLLDGHKANSEELNNLVAACKLINDRVGHPQYGYLITACDIFDVNDPFFKNKELKLRLAEGLGMLDLTNSLDKILYEGALANKRFQQGGDKVTGPLSSSTKYILVNSEIDRKSKEETRGQDIKSTELFSNMSAAKKIQLAFVLGLIKNTSEDSALVDDILWDYSKDNKTLGFENLTKQQYFIKLAEATPEHTTMLVDIKNGIKAGFIKRHPDRYECFGTVIGKDEQSAISYLTNPGNSELYLKLKSALEAS